MADPNEYAIVRNLQVALQAMTVAGGYYYTVAAGAVKLDPDHGVEMLKAPDGARPFMVIEIKPETWDYHQARRVKLVLHVAIHWVHDSTSTADESWMQTCLRGYADIERAVAADITRGNLAVDTRIVGRTFDRTENGALVWVIVDVDISLHRVYGLP